MIGPVLNISASLMCCNILKLQEEIHLLENAHCDSLHIDIMDGRFVKNLAMNFYEIEAIKKITSMPLDVHLMVENPSEFLDKLIRLKPDCITYHFESSDDISFLINETKKYNIKAGIALNHDTSIDNITEELMAVTDKILIMSVITGFTGQTFINPTYEKVAKLKKRIEDFGFKHLVIEVDGGLDENNIPRLYRCGAISYVLGTKGLFRQEANYCNRIKTIRDSIQAKDEKSQKNDIVKLAECIF